MATSQGNDPKDNRIQLATMCCDVITWNIFLVVTSLTAVRQNGKSLPNSPSTTSRRRHPLCHPKTKQKTNLQTLQLENLNQSNPLYRPDAKSSTRLYILTSVSAMLGEVSRL